MGSILNPRRANYVLALWAALNGGVLIHMEVRHSVLHDEQYFSGYEEQ